MGGALRVPGNISPLSEFNFGNDAAGAALIVVAFSGKLSILPLDVTMQCLFTEDDLNALTKRSGSVGKWFAQQLAPFYMNAYRSINSMDMPLHDAHTLMALIRPDLYLGCYSCQRYYLNLHHPHHHSALNRIFHLHALLYCTELYCTPPHSDNKHM